MKIRILPLILLLSLTSYCSEKKKENNNILALLLLAGNQSSPERTQVIDEYNATYLGATVVNNGWTGSVSGCNPGITSQDANNKTLARVNYFRKQVGLPSVSFDSSTDGKTQSAALMMKANNALSHNPPGSWTCYTADGASGAASSNLYLGVHSAAAITGYIEDPGAGNTAVGHRRWILYSKSQKIGRQLSTRFEQ